MEQFHVAFIRRDSQLWPREGLDERLVTKFATRYREDGPDALPPVLLTEDGRLIDGWHRTEAALRAGLAEVPVERCPLSDGLEIWREALRRSASSSKPMTLAERRRAAAVMIEHYGDQMSDRAIARECAVDRSVIRRLRNGDCDEPAPRDVEGAGDYSRNAAALVSALDRLYDECGGSEEEMASALVLAAMKRHGDGAWGPVTMLHGVAEAAIVAEGWDA